MPRGRKAVKPIHEELNVVDSDIVTKVAMENISETPEVKDEPVKKGPFGRPKVSKTVSTAPVFPKSQYYMEVESEVNVSDDARYPDYQIVKTDKLKREFATNPHRIKCRIRTAKHYNVTIDHLQFAYNELSGKKIDGIIINDLIDRHGFSDGEQMNRFDVAKRNNINYFAVDVADEKLKKIISNLNVLEEYKAYLKTFTAEKEHDIKRNSFNV